MDQLDRLGELPSVSEALRLPYEEYKKHADGIIDYRFYCESGLVESLPIVQDWCVHLNCTEIGGSCTPLPANLFTAFIQNVSTPPSSTAGTSVLLSTIANTSSWNFLPSACYNGSSCYDEFLCDHDGISLASHYVLGYVCFLLCLFGMVSNLVLLPAYNLGPNRSGVTVYLSAMSVFDLAYLVLTLLIVVSRYMHKDFRDQVESYARFAGRLIPIGNPVMQFCELMVVWIVVALLANRLLYMKLGYQSKLLCSQLQSLKVITALVILGLAYCGCQLLEYSYEECGLMGFVRVVRTPIGKNLLFRNLMHNWLRVPIQMFLPYLTVGALTFVVVRKMLKFHTSKWKAVASLCNDTACACVCRTGVCGTVCKESAFPSPAVRPVPNPADVISEQPREKQPPLSAKPLGSTPDPIEQELAYIFFQLPQGEETREYANVVTTVCISLLLLLLKVPKFILHVLSSEHYITYDPVVFRMVDQILDTVFAVCKPTVCILIGAHFRRVLLAPTQSCSRQTTRPIASESQARPDEMELESVRA